ncbi:lipoxygenase [Lipomyces tetrasporus]
MERLSFSPMAVRRLDPVEESLPFTLTDVSVEKIAGATLEWLHSSGNLFYVDFREQGILEKTERFMAACDAYFYIYPISGDFLPLAIRPNAGGDLIYTPLDSPNDWLLAKMMFNVNDVGFTQLYHFAGTHAVASIVRQAAIRTLSDHHPVLGMLNRAPSMALPPVYFEYWRPSRGLYRSKFGPQLKSFPFLEDAAEIEASLREFFTSFVNSYYPCVVNILKDVELQNWMKEAAAAEIIDFPLPPLVDTSTLIDILTHLAYLTTVLHHTLNTNDLFSSARAEQAIGAISLAANFNRPQSIVSNSTLLHLFDEPRMLARLNDASRDAAQHFTKVMQNLSEVISSRTFDADGLSQGMPFVWKALDPNVAPDTLAV